MADIINTNNNIEESKIVPVIKSLIDKSLTNQIDLLDKLNLNKDWATNLKVANAKLTEENKNLKAKNHILVITRDEYGEDLDKVTLELTDDRVKQLANKAKDQEIAKLKVNVEELTKARDDMKINSQLQIQTLKENVNSLIIKAEDKDLNNKITLAQIRNDLKETRQQILEERREKHKEINEIRHKADLDLKEQVSTYRDRLNTVIVKLNTLRTEFENFHDNVINNFFLKFAGKRVRNILNIIKSTSWKTRDLLHV